METRKTTFGTRTHTCIRAELSGKPQLITKLGIIGLINDLERKYKLIN